MFLQKIIDFLYESFISIVKYESKKSHALNLVTLVCLSNPQKKTLHFNMQQLKDAVIYLQKGKNSQSIIIILLIFIFGDICNSEYCQQ